MLSRALLLLVSAATFLGASTGCTGLTKPESISIAAEPKPAAAQQQQQQAAPQAAPEPEAAPGCGE